MVLREGFSFSFPFTSIKAQCRSRLVVSIPTFAFATFLPFAFTFTQAFRSTFVYKELQLFLIRRASIFRLIINHVMLKVLELSFARLICVLRLLAQEAWKVSIKFFCSSSEMRYNSSIRGIVTARN